MVKAAQMIESPWADTSTLEAATFEHLFDMQDQLPVTRSRAMKIPTVSKARRIIATSIGKLPSWSTAPTVSHWKRSRYSSDSPSRV